METLLMEDIYKTSTKTIIDLQNKNAKLRMGARFGGSK